MGDAQPQVWDSIVEHLEFVLKEFEFQGEDIQIEWKKLANSRMTDRLADQLLDEKYGIFKVFFIHPLVQKFLGIWDKYDIKFDIVLGDPIIPFATALILLFMMHKRISNEILMLIAALIFNANPIYVVGGVLIWQISQTTKKPKQFQKLTTKSPLAPASFQDLISCGPTPFDHVLIGNDISTLYCAAILSKNGHRCCVLQPKSLPGLEVQPEGMPTPIPIRNLSIGKVDRYQSLLDAAQSLDIHSQHKEGEGGGGGGGGGRVLLAPIGFPKDGFTHTVLRRVTATATTGGVQGQGQGRGGTGATSTSCWSRSTVCVLRAGQTALADDLSVTCSADKTTVQSFMTTMITLQSTVTLYLMSRVNPIQWSAALKDSSAKPFFDMIRDSCAKVLSRLRDSAETREFLFTSAMSSQDEVLPPSECSSFVLATATAMGEEGLYYPIGGATALQKTLTATIVAAGGGVYGDVPVFGLSMSDENTQTGRVTGVVVSGATGDSHSHSHPQGSSSGSGSGSVTYTVKASKSVVSGLGTLCTYTRLVPSSALSLSTKQSLSTLTEARPKILVLIWLQCNAGSTGTGTGTTLGLSPCDYFERPASSLSSSSHTTSPDNNDNDNDSNEGHDVEVFVDGWVRIWSPSCKDPEWKNKYPDWQTVVVELGVGDQLTSLVPHKYKHANTPPGTTVTTSTTFNTAAFTTPVVGPRMYTTGKVNKSEGGGGGGSDSSHNSSSSCDWGVSIPLTKGQKDRAKTRALSKLTEVYPLAAAAAAFVHILPPCIGGLCVSATPEKFSTPLGATSDIPGLFLCGRDVATSGLAGELQGGWVAANATLGYGVHDLLGGRDLVSDLKKQQTDQTIRLSKKQHS